MRDDPVIPKRNRVWTPFEANLVIGIFTDLAEEKRQYRVRLGFRNANNPSRKSWVDVYTLPLRSGVHTDNGVDRFDFPTAYRKSSRPITVGLGYGAMYRRQTLEIRLQTRA